MLTISELSEVASITNPAIRQLVMLRFQQLLQSVAPTHSGEFIVVEGGEAVSEIEHVVGFPILSSLFDGLPFTDPNFQPCSEILEEHHHEQHRIYEMVFIGSDDGAFTCLVIPDEERVDGDLLAMCQAFATTAVNTP